MSRTNLLKLSSRSKELDEDMQQHDRLLALIEKSPANIDTVARQRNFFTEHLRIRIQASYDDQKRREEIAAITKKCLTIVQEYDRNAEDFMSLSAVQTKFVGFFAHATHLKSLLRIEGIYFNERGGETSPSHLTGIILATMERWKKV